MAPRRFSLEEAEALLPQLTALLSRLLGLKQEHDRLQRSLAELGLKMKSNGQLLGGEPRMLRQDAESVSGEMRDLIAQIQQTGCELKDTDMGLIDFRSERDGREIYLCWKLGEERIAWWHELHTGYASRQPL